MKGTKKIPAYIAIEFLNYVKSFVFFPLLCCFAGIFFLTFITILSFFSPDLSWGQYPVIQFVMSFVPNHIDTSNVAPILWKFWFFTSIIIYIVKKITELILQKKVNLTYKQKTISLITTLTVLYGFIILATFFQLGIFSHISGGTPLDMVIVWIIYYIISVILTLGMTSLLHVLETVKIFVGTTQINDRMLQ